MEANFPLIKTFKRELGEIATGAVADSNDEQQKSLMGRFGERWVDWGERMDSVLK